MTDAKPCCTPDRGTAAIAVPVHAGAATGSDEGARFVHLDGGEFLMGSNDRAAHPLDGEGPVRRVVLAPFAIDAFAVSNRRFTRFVSETGYHTESEVFGWSFVFANFLPDDHPPTQAVAATPWWRQVMGASWQHPEGPGSGIADRLDHPVVHVSHNDALAYCAWAGARLPSEAEWEFSARGGLEQKRFPWGDDLMSDGKHRLNIWQGEFPQVDTGEDGFRGTAPVDAFEPNGYGLHNVVGNTWEWSADWFSPRHDPIAAINPRGPAQGSGRVIRGGSFLCHASYCFRYRVSARSQATPDSATGHMGFRIARG